MSTGDDGPGRREVAWRLFATEYEDADLQYSESDEERAPNYVVTPSGARMNRLFLVGVLTERERVNEDMLRGRIVDPTGAFVVYAGQYQPDELAFLERADPPAFLAVAGKARTFRPEDSDRVFTSIRPESIAEVDAETRDRWVVDAARRTVERVEIATRAIDSGRSDDDLRSWLVDDGVDPSLAAGVARALDHYGTTPAYLAELRRVAVDAARVVVGEIEAVEDISIAPDEGGGDGPAREADADTRADTKAEEKTGTKPASDDDGATADDPEAADVDVGIGSDPSTADGPDADDEIGDFDIDDLGAETGAADDADPEVDADVSFDPDEEVLDPEERREIEDEFGTDFSTADDVESGPDDDPDTDADTGVDAEPGDADAVDLETAVLDAMDALDDGDGADRAAVAQRVADEYGIEETAADEAIEDAMMSGRCYEPADGRVKSI